MGTDAEEDKPSLALKVVVLVTGFLLVLTSAGITYTFGLVVAVLVDQLDITTTEAAALASVEQCVFCFTGVLALPVVEKIGWRWSSLLGTLLSVVGLLLSSVSPYVYIMYVTYGVVAGLGLGVLFFLGFVVSQNYLIEHMTVGFAVVATGFECGLMIFSPLVQYLLDTVGLRWTFRVMAGLSLVGLLGVLFYKPLHNVKSAATKQRNEYEDINKDNKLSATKSDMSLRSADEQKTFLIESEETGCCSSCGSMMSRFADNFRYYLRLDFILFGLAFFCYSWTCDTPFTFLPLRAQKADLTGSQSSMLLIIYGCCGIAVRVFIILLPCENFKITVITTGLCLFIAGAVSPLTPILKSYSAFAIYSAVLGSTLAYVISTFIFIVAALLGIESKEEATAGTIAFSAIAGIGTGPVGGSLMSATGSDDAPFLVCGVMGLCGFLLYVVAVYRQKQNLANYIKEEQVKLFNTSALETFTDNNHVNENTRNNSVPQNEQRVVTAS